MGPIRELGTAALARCGLSVGRRYHNWLLGRAVTLAHQGLGHLGVTLHKPLSGLGGVEGVSGLGVLSCTTMTWRGRLSRV